MSTHNLCFEKNKKKDQNFSAENFQFLKLKNSLSIAWASFGKVRLKCSYQLEVIFPARLDKVHQIILPLLF